MTTATLTNLRDYLYGTLSPANIMYIRTINISRMAANKVIEIVGHFLTHVKAEGRLESLYLFTDGCAVVMKPPIFVSSVQVCCTLVNEQE